MSDLTPYDTGARCQPVAHRPDLKDPDSYGLVDFDNDESATVATAWVSRDPSDQYRLTVEPAGDNQGLQISVQAPSVTLWASDLVCGDILIGDHGGRSQIHDIEESATSPGMLLIETEHGPLYLRPSENCTIVNSEPRTDPLSDKIYYVIKNGAPTGDSVRAPDYDVAHVMAVARHGRDVDVTEGPPKED